MTITRLEENLYLLEIDPTEKNVGNYTPTVNLTDKNKNPMRTVYQIKIEIKGDLPPGDEPIPSSERVKP